MRIAYFLVPSLGSHAADFERQSAEVFRDAAARAGVERIIYRGGTRPKGEVSKHLRSRLRTGEILRAGAVPTVELRGGMIIGQGSESWCIVRDLSVRLPVMVLPRWLDHRSQPIAIEDVVFALGYAGTMDLRASCVFGLPGPDTLSGTEVQALELLDRLVTRANFDVARELVEGLTSDLTNDDDNFWARVPEYRRATFAEAARWTVSREAPDLSLKTRVVEEMIRRVSPKA